MTTQAQVTVVPASEALAEIIDSGIPTVVEVSASTLQQPVAAIRIDASVTGIIYAGRASYGALESSAEWTITKSTFNASGALMNKMIAVNVNWTNRTSHTYT